MERLLRCWDGLALVLSVLNVTRICCLVLYVLRILVRLNVVVHCLLVLGMFVVSDIVVELRVVMVVSGRVTVLVIVRFIAWPLLAGTLRLVTLIALSCRIILSLGARVLSRMRRSADPFWLPLFMTVICEAVAIARLMRSRMGAVLCAMEMLEVTSRV